MAILNQHMYIYIYVYIYQLVTTSGHPFVAVKWRNMACPAKNFLCVLATF